jgi:hypothetical protein
LHSIGTVQTACILNGADATARLHSTGTISMQAMC